MCNRSTSYITYIKEVPKRLFIQRKCIHNLLWRNIHSFMILSCAINIFISFLENIWQNVDLQFCWILEFIMNIIFKTKNIFCNLNLPCTIIIKFIWMLLLTLRHDLHKFLNSYRVCQFIKFLLPQCTLHTPVPVYSLPYITYTVHWLPNFNMWLWHDEFIYRLAFY